ncbi:MAG: hypothetical protein J6P44_04330 [Bacteroidales bacterium]|nr:hypothetical protein [Bacteroidales bacterium]
MKKRLTNGLFTVLIAVSSLLTVSCNDDNDKEERNRETSDYKTEPLEQYISGTWVIDANQGYGSDDTLIFKDKVFYWSCTGYDIGYTSTEDKIIKTYIDGEEKDVYEIERIFEDTLIIHGFQPCHVFTQDYKHVRFIKTK